MRFRRRDYIPACISGDFRPADSKIRPDPHRREKRIIASFDGTSTGHRYVRAGPFFADAARLAHRASRRFYRCRNSGFHRCFSRCDCGIFRGQGRLGHNAFRRYYAVLPELLSDTYRGGVAASKYLQYHDRYRPDELDGNYPLCPSRVSFLARAR